MTAPTTASVNKFSIYDYNGGPLSRVSFSTVIDGTSGTFNFFSGNGISFADANAFTGAQSFVGLQFALAAGGITTTYRNASGNSATGLTTSGITTGSVLQFDTFGNNTATFASYGFAGGNNALPSDTFDIYLNGVLIGDDLATSTLPVGTNIDSFMFYGTNSAGNVGTLRLDNLTYANELPALVAASNLFFDVNGATAGSGVAANGVYSTANGLFGPDTNGGGATGAFTNGQTATFSAGPDATGLTYTVAIDSAISTNGLTFEEGNVTLGAGTGTLTLSGPTVTVATGASATISEEILGTVGLAKAGPGTLTLAAANTYTGGTTITAGTLQVGNGGTSGTLGAGTVTNNGTLAFNRSDALTVGNAISGNGSVSQIGAGTTTLAGATTYSGATTVTGGSLINNAGNPNSAITVGGTGAKFTGNGGTFGNATINSGGTLAGNGTFGIVTVNSGGTIAPGNSPGTITVASLALAGTYVAEVDGFGTGQFDLIDVTAGAVNLTGSTLNLVFGPALTGGTVGDFLGLIANDAADPITSTFTNAAQGATVSSGAYTFAYTYLGAGGTGNDFGLVITAITVIPEPSRALLLLAGAGLLMGRRRRRA